MFNPFALFDEKILEAFVASGKKYFVRQTFDRARNHFDEGIKGYFLFCHYDNYFLAKEHFDAIAHDSHRRLYDWNDASDRQKLHIAAAQPAGYTIYCNLFRPGWEKLITNRIKQKIRLYVASLHWKLPANAALAPQFFPHFGEVFVSLSYKGREVRVKFEEIEKLS